MLFRFQQPNNAYYAAYVFRPSEAHKMCSMVAAFFVLIHVSSYASVPNSWDDKNEQASIIYIALLWHVSHELNVSLLSQPLLLFWNQNGMRKIFSYKLFGWHK